VRGTGGRASWGTRIRARPSLPACRRHLCRCTSRTAPIRWMPRNAASSAYVSQRPVPALSSTSVPRHVTGRATIDVLVTGSIRGTGILAETFDCQHTLGSVAGTSAALLPAPLLVTTVCAETKDGQGRACVRPASRAWPRSPRQRGPSGAAEGARPASGAPASGGTLCPATGRRRLPTAVSL
jgi:hypothetical protein